MAQQTRNRTTAKKAVPKQPQDRKPPSNGSGPIDESDFEPVVIDSSEVPEVKMVPLFTIDDTEYPMPETITPNVAVKFLNDVANLGTEVALARAMQTVIGKQGMDALAACEAVTDKQLAQIMQIVERKLYGTIDSDGGGK